MYLETSLEELECLQLWAAIPGFWHVHAVLGLGSGCPCGLSVSLPCPSPTQPCQALTTQSPGPEEAGRGPGACGAWGSACSPRLETCSHISTLTIVRARELKATRWGGGVLTVPGLSSCSGLSLSESNTDLGGAAVSDGVK